MTLSLAMGLLAFAFVSSITPGPNNIMLMASGATYGFRLTLPHMMGVALGFGAMVLLVGLGLASVFAAVPWLQDVVRVVGVGYLLYLAYKIGTARAISDKDASTRPITFTQAALFQWVNPKAWTMVVGAIGAYVPKEQPFKSVVIVALIFTLVNLPCITTWTVFGVGLRGVLKSPAALRAFNLTMALLLVLSLYPILREIDLSYLALGS